MNKQIDTLGDLIRGHECAFARVVYEAVNTSLMDMGERVRDLDWANVAIAIQSGRLEAA